MRTADCLAAGKSTLPLTPHAAALWSAIPIASGMTAMPHPWWVAIAVVLAAALVELARCRFEHSLSSLAVGVAAVYSFMRETWEVSRLQADGALMRAYLRTTVLSFQVFSPIRPPFQTNARQREA
jgi:hypothetical protein